MRGLGLVCADKSRKLNTWINVTPAPRTRVDLLRQKVNANTAVVMGRSGESRRNERLRVWNTDASKGAKTPPAAALTGRQ